MTLAHVSPSLASPWPLWVTGSRIRKTVLTPPRGRMRQTSEICVSLCFLESRPHPYWLVAPQDQPSGLPPTLSPILPPGEAVWV